MHRSTLETKLLFFQFVKLGSHNMSLYHPLQRQNTQKQIAHRLIGMADIWDATTWKKWCADLKQHERMPKKALLAGAEQRKATRAAVKATQARVKAAPKPLPNILKRPSAAIPPPPKRQRTRRHPFALRVVAPLIRPGRHKTRVPTACQ